MALSLGLSICYRTTFPLQQRLSQTLFPVAACLMAENSSSKHKVSFFPWSQNSETPIKLIPTSCHRIGRKKKSVFLMNLTWAKRTNLFELKCMQYTSEPMCIQNHRFPKMSKKPWVVLAWDSTSNIRITEISWFSSIPEQGLVWCSLGQLWTRLV